MITCNICHVNLSGPTDEVAHMAGKRHRQMMRTSAQNTAQVPNTHNRPPNRRQNTGAPRAQIAPRPNPTNNNAQSNQRPPRGSRQVGSFQPPHPSASSGAQGNTHQAPQPEPETQDFGAYEPDGRYDADFGVFLNHERGPHLQYLEVSSNERPEVEFYPVMETRRTSLAGYQLTSVALKSPSCYEICVEFNPANVRGGIHIVRVHVADTWFKLKATVGRLEDHKQLKPISKYKRGRRLDDSNWHRERLRRGEGLESTTNFKRIPGYDVPKEYRDQFDTANGDHVFLESLVRSKIPVELNVDTYETHWKYLLWHEELQIEEDLKVYDMTRATIQRVAGNDYSVEVPGLLEKRPSVIVTDLVAVRKTDSGFGGLQYNKKSPAYGGVVVKVQLSELIFRLPKDFPWVSQPQWDVRFTINRLLFRRMHDSVHKAKLHGRILFPGPGHQNTPLPESQTSLVLDRKIASNAQQSLAVRRIATKSPGGIPFVIFGPPGTGKTTVLVESIRQVVDTQPNSRVLVCAPSNEATDLIATRLIGRYSPDELIRLNAPSRSYGDLPAPLRKYAPHCMKPAYPFLDPDRPLGATLPGDRLSSQEQTHTSQGNSPRLEKRFEAPPADKLKEYKIVVSTCCYASIPPALGISDHFTHIFVDEAGHAAESEIMIPILQNASKSTRVIVSGDPMQLGPIIQSKACIKSDMDISFLERLIKLRVYGIKPGDTSNPNIVKLLQNYRSHPAILNYSNHVFYDSELKYCADPSVTGSLLQFPELPTQGFPVIFHNICGENLRESKSPSFFNIEEATIVNRYVTALLKNRRWKLEPKHIGVIVPYRQQCTKIKQLLQKEKHGGVDVKVTENWQGQEKRVIIISTVRSDPELLEDNPTQFLGFVSSWRRTNVALTRAQALLIVIGNGPILELDPIWYFFMRFVHDSGGWAGPGDIATFTPDPAEQGFNNMEGVNKDYNRFIEERRDKLNWVAKAESLQA